MRHLEAFVKGKAVRGSGRLFQVFERKIFLCVCEFVRRIENMILSRRFLRTAALAAVFALAFAGTALAADTYTWKGGAAAGAKKWSVADNWEKVGGGNGVPAATETAIIGANAEVEVDGAAANAKVVDLGEGAKLTIKTDSLTLER